jgi:hypothetical protein
LKLTYGLKFTKFAVKIGSGVVFVYTMTEYCNNVIDEFLEDMGNLTDNFDDLSTGSDNELVAENRQAKRSRLIPFYRTRKDILRYFSVDKLMTTFRFDRPSIEYITGFIIQKLLQNESPLIHELSIFQHLLPIFYHDERQKHGGIYFHWIWY